MLCALVTVTVTGVIVCVSSKTIAALTTAVMDVR